MEPAWIEKFLQARSALPSEIVEAFGVVAIVCLLGTIHALFHEIAHAAAYALARRPPQVVGIGVAQAKICRTFIVFPLPLSGFTDRLYGSTDASLGRTSRALARISGPAATAGATAASIHFAKTLPPDDAWKFVLALFAALGAFALPGNLILPGSDGAKFRRDLVRRQESPPVPRTTAQKAFAGLAKGGLFAGSIAAGILLAAAAAAVCCH
ncbi:MAG: hypothetical protein ACPLRW_07485 [Moorellales bacterium]